jgi:FkbM family methyltransferase
MNNTIGNTDTNPRLWNTRYGLATAIPADNPAARSLQLYGEWAEQEIDLLSGLIQDGQTVLEFGGEYGAHTLWLAQAVGSEGEVHVAEPTRLAFQLLCANVAINGLQNVYTHARWLGRGKGHAALSSLPGRVMQKNVGEENVRTGTVDELALESLHLVKMNVPGALIDLLAGAAETIRRHRPVIYARLSGIERAEEEVQALKDLGYRCWSHVPYLFNTDNHAKHAANVFPGCVSQNVIASPVEGRFELDARREL